MSSKRSTDKCSGHCCKNFSLPLSPEELMNEYHRWHSVRDGRQLGKEETNPTQVLADIHIIAPMVEYLGKKAKPPKFVNGKDAPGDGHRYRCKLWDSKTKLCTIYEIRPQMCRDYPGPGGCNFAACTWKSRKRVKWNTRGMTKKKKFDESELKEAIDLIERKTK